MKHRALAPALSVVAAALFAAGGASDAFAADPSGIWVKDDGSAKVEVKKCGRGICSEVVWLRHPKDSLGKPLHDARNENPSLRDRPIIGLPLFSNMHLTEPNTWVGNVYNPIEGRTYRDVKVTLVSRQQIVLRGCKTWLLCGEKTWTRSYLPKSPERPIVVKAPAEPGSNDMPEAPPKFEGPLIEVYLHREPLPVPGLTLVGFATRWGGPAFSGGNVSSMIAMTTPWPTTSGPASSLTETATAEEQGPLQQRRSRTGVQAEAPTASSLRLEKSTPEPVVKHAEGQWPWMQHRSVHLASGAVAPRFRKPKPIVKQAREQWPWLRRRSRTLVKANAPAPASPSLEESTPKPMIREAQEKVPWLERRSVDLASGG